MADMTITWKGAVPFDGLVGQAEPIGAKAIAIVDPAMISSGFDIQPFLDTGFEAMMKGAVPYVEVSEGELEDLFLEETPKKVDS